MRRPNKNILETTATGAENDNVFRGTEVRCGGSNPMRLMGIFVSCLMVLSVLFSVTVIINDPPKEGIWGGAHARILAVEHQIQAIDSGDDSSLSSKVSEEELLGGLLTTGFDKKTCQSRYQSAIYGHPLTHNPSPHLIAKLRSYEALHKRCGPHTESYRKATELLNLGKQSGPSDCNYLVWISYSGLGNRILTLASAFLYALVTDRVLLVDRGKDIADLFCEPFPNVSWLLPKDFPLTSQFDHFDQKSAESYGNKLKSNVFTNTSDKAIPASLYLYLGHDYDDQDKLFFCDQDQTFFKEVPWLIMKTDNYFIPSLFLIPSFEQELSNLFPEKQSVFHFLGRYLFHPTNQVWGLITRFYQAYLAKADEKIGVQIRVFDTRVGPFQYVFDQILSCLVKERMLPEITKLEQTISPIENPETKAVLVTSLNSGYLEKLRDMYWEYPTTTGEVISFFQPSHEQYQQTENQMHNMKAWAEMYLLSLTDKLVTSSWSTFGYVAQGLGGLRPWILYKPENQTAPNPPCHRAMSMEPCFHAPPFYDCKRKSGVDTGLLVPHVRHCEDMSWGLKLVDSRK